MSLSTLRWESSKCFTECNIPAPQGIICLYLHCGGKAPNVLQNATFLPPKVLSVFIYTAVGKLQMFYRMQHSCPPRYYLSLSTLQWESSKCFTECNIPAPQGIICLYLHCGGKAPNVLQNVTFLPPKVLSVFIYTGWESSKCFTECNIPAPQGIICLYLHCGGKAPNVLQNATFLPPKVLSVFIYTAVGKLQMFFQDVAFLPHKVDLSLSLLRHKGSKRFSGCSIPAPQGSICLYPYCGIRALNGFQDVVCLPHKVGSVHKFTAVGELQTVFRM